MEGKKINITLNGNQMEAIGLMCFKYYPNNKEYLVYSLTETVNHDGKKLEKVYVSEVHGDNIQPIDDETWEKIKVIIAKIGGGLS